MLAAYFPIVIGRESFYHFDRYSLHVPYWHFSWESISQGHFPFWAPGVRAGYPLFANGEAGLLYPFTYLFLPFFQAHRALDLFTLFHLVMGGLFCWLFLSQLTKQRSVALAGALAFALSGQMNGMTIWPNAVAAAAYLPLLLWGIDRRKITSIALAIGLGLLTGRPQVHVLSILIAGAYATLRCAQQWQNKGRFPASLFATLSVGFGLGACLGSAQMLPTLAFIGESSRSVGTAFREWSSFTLSSSHLRQMLVPGYYPNGLLEAGSYPTLFVYFGLVVGLIKLCTTRRIFNRSDTLFWLLLATISIYFAFGGPGAYRVSQEIPLIRSFRVPARLVYVASFAGIVIATMAWQRTPIGRWKWSWMLVGLVLLDCTITSFSDRYSIPESAYEQTPKYVPEMQNADRDERGSRRRYFADGHLRLQSSSNQLDLISVGHFFDGNPPAQNLALRYGLRSVQGYGEPVYSWFLPATQELTLNMFRQFGTRWLFLRDPVESTDLSLLESATPYWVGYQLRSPLPRAKVLYQTLLAHDSEEAFNAASHPRFDPATVAIVEEVIPPVRFSADPQGSVRIRSETPNRLELAVNSTHPGYLVLFDTWAPGWSAKVNRIEQSVLRANGLFRFVSVPAGTSSVEFNYIPPGLANGLALSILAALGLVLMQYREVRRRRASDAQG